MSINDFLATHPTPPEPVPAPVRDTVAEAFGGRRGGSMRLVDNSVCKVGCKEHEHVNPIFRPEPSLDETAVGWTVQHIPTDPSRHIVPKHCIFCWEPVDGHECQVLEVVNG